MMIISGLLGIHIPTTKTLRAVILLAVALGAGAVFGQGHTLWQDGGVQLCGPTALDPVLAVSDSAGGAIVLWMDTRNGVYAQRVDAAGVTQWAEDGVLLCDSTGHTHNFAATDDGRQGAIAVWGPYGSQFAVQRVSAQGVPLWDSSGLVLRPGVVGLVEYPALMRDGQGGAIVVWNAHPIDPSSPDTLIACGVDSSGNKQWETVVRIDTLYIGPPCLCADGSGCVVIAWSEYNGNTGLAAARAQRIDSAGAIKWYASGVPLCTTATMQCGVQCVEAGGSRIVASWLDGDGDSLRRRAQMLDLTGNRLWGPAGVPLSSGSNSSTTAAGLPTMNAKQSVWVWGENRSGTDDMFAQKLDSTGARWWDTTGVWLGTSDTTSMYRGFSVTVDGRGGTIAAWSRHRSGLNWDIHAQHVDSAGHLSWSDTGLAVCQDSYDQSRTPAVVTDGDGGAIVAWLSYQDVYACRIYAQRVADAAGITESHKPQAASRKLEATVVRGVLWLGGRGQTTGDRAVLLDATGRKVMDLRHGANDAGALAPGVYFVRRAQAQAQAQAVQKIVVTR